MSGLYARVLGPVFAKLAPLLRDFHNTASVDWQGQAEVMWAPRRWVRLLLRCTPLPRPGRQVALRFRIVAHRGHEVWEREFAGQRAVSRQFAGQGVFIERFGPARLALQQTVVDGALWQHTDTIRVLGIPVPRWFGLRVSAQEWAEAAGLHFDVCLYCGQSEWLRYTGRLTRVDAAVTT